MNVEPFTQWYPRATLLTDYTADWNFEYQNAEQPAMMREQIPLFSSTDPSVETVTVNEDCLNPGTSLEH
jgi:hypothetical protein